MSVVASIPSTPTLMGNHSSSTTISHLQSAGPAKGFGGTKSFDEAMLTWDHHGDALPTIHVPSHLLPPPPPLTSSSGSGGNALTSDDVIISNLSRSSPLLLTLDTLTILTHLGADVRRLVVDYCAPMVDLAQIYEKKREWNHAFR
jgi:hypothetical protein